MLLSEKNKHHFDVKIKFQKNGHKYWINDSETNVCSVTTYIKNFFKKFDTQKIINNILKSDKYKNPDYKYHNNMIQNNYLNTRHLVYLRTNKPHLHFFPHNNKYHYNCY